MHAVILAAGRGTRMGPLTESTPKPMLPVADAPLVEHVADAAVEAGADELVVTVGYGADRIRRHFGESHRGVPVRYAVQESQRGTADALAAAADHLDDEFAVLNGDSLYRGADLRRLFESPPRIGAFRVDDPTQYGVLTVDGDAVTAVREKPSDPATDLVNAGAYSFPAETVDMLDVPESERGERELTDVLARVMAREELGYAVLAEWMDVGRPWELLEANERRLPGGGSDGRDDGGSAGREDGDTACSDATIRGDVHANATIRGDVVVEAGATVGPGVVVEGPALLRSGCSVGPNAYVRGATLVGEGAHVGHAVEIKNSVLMADATVGHLSYVGDSVLGPSVNLGAGTNVANLRHDGEPVNATVKGERVSTGRRKFGAVLGPRVKTGIQTGINAGVTLSADAHTEPGEIVRRDR
ncbi:sugar phosphate nucleotidyltransferase [Halorubrum sp. Ea8]|uniref:sugar phosphate nucleotidyltransferase n=1 Tax=Halorubrum sp. Ea8 TaxID=1383841 RepID=UPI000B97DA7F|nr:sugar phosphate nucleotidyltransferase [Halorubrum sp. Ea8]OYR48360.1 glucose-1-phosphate thymidylyltransferase [Halorubrum sp. Ea8]